MTDTKIAETTIVIHDREKSATAVNELLTKYGDFIISRMGVPHHEKKIYIISIVMEGPIAEIDDLNAKLGQLPDLRVKTMVV